MPHRIKTQWSTKGPGIEPAIQQYKKYLQNRGFRDSAIKVIVEIMARCLKGLDAGGPTAKTALASRLPRTVLVAAMPSI